MRFYIFATLITFGSSTNVNLNTTDTKLTPKFHLLEKKNSNGAPSVAITFPDGHKDTLILNKFHGNENDKKDGVEWCFYNGHLEKEPEACVAMTGCVGLEDVEFTIFSGHSESKIFKWTKDGNVEVINDLSEVSYCNLHLTYSMFKEQPVSKSSFVPCQTLKINPGKWIDFYILTQQKDTLKLGSSLVCFYVLFHMNLNEIYFIKNEIEGRSKIEFDDAVIVPEFEDDFIAARKKCHGGGCSLPPTQHLKMRVILKTYTIKSRVLTRPVL